MAGTEAFMKEGLHVNRGGRFLVQDDVRGSGQLLAIDKDA